MAPQTDFAPEEAPPAADGDPAARRPADAAPLGSGLRAYTPTLWRAQQRQLDGRPKQERDSIRSRSKEGRPGSRKHRRFTRSQELVTSLRKAMAACGEDHHAESLDGVLEDSREVRPSVFYRLLEKEGPTGALDAWAAAESARGRPRSRPRRERPKTDVQAAEEAGRAARQAFGENWQYIHGSEAAKVLLLELEGMAARAFGSTSTDPTATSTLTKAPDAAEGTSLQEWLVHWDGAAMTTKSGTPPAEELAVMGLDPAQRKFVHQFARLLGLHSESRAGGDGSGEDGLNTKVLSMRPPRRSPCASSGKAWAATLSLARVLAVN